MSRLTASPFHKPSPYQFPRPVHPLSPPDTDSEIGAPLQPTSIPESNPVEFDPTVPPLPPHSDSPSARPKRVSTLVYHNSGLLEPRERSTTSTSKSLLVIIPPESFSRGHGQLGHTLASGPRNRLSQGLLMPLFPTMYAQLTAIAREFNFPSTAGLCLYLHITDNGITITPRISDESWQLLWGHLLNGSAPASGPLRLPIGGRIEFDIDLSKARWYSSWIATSQRDAAERSRLSHTPSPSHWRGGSQTTFATDQVDDEQQESPSVIQQTQVPLSTIRHIPRKLSLVDRFESWSTQSASKPVSQSGKLLPEPPETQVMPALSPIMQADEPQTAKQDLDTKVKNWRTGASLTPNPLPPTGEIGFPVGNMSMGLPVDNLCDSLTEDACSKLNLDDFTWSVSSAGPQSEDPNSPMSYDHLPSVHLDRRIKGSICVTPSACTSFGPFDYDLHSPAIDTLPLPSPDIAQRMMEDCPPTATTATSWGAPLSYPPTPLSGYRAPSIHIGDRGDLSRPVTPSTATTWGPPISYPPTPNTPFYVHTPDAGQRAFDPCDLAPKGTPWTYVWPYRYSQSRDCPNQSLPIEIVENPSASNYPHLNIYPGVYPYLDLYPAVAAAEVESTTSNYLPIEMQATYPVFDIYPELYPYFNIYSAVSVMTIPAFSQPMSQTITPLPVCYPNHNIYPSLYPESLDVIYPSLEVEKLNSALSVNLAVQYPQFDLYPSVYPFITLYPPHIASSAKLHFMSDCGTSSPDLQLHREYLSVSVDVVYPVFNIYPATYPAFDIYPSPCLLDFDAPFTQKNTMRPCLSYSVCAYPDLDIYPGLQRQDAISLSGRLDVVYPAFNLYPPVYPTIELYPTVRAPGELPRDVQSSWARSSEQILNRSLSVRSDRVYPNFDIYPVVYPHFNIYPSEYPNTSESSLTDVAPAAFMAAYPALDIYPAVHLDIDPELLGDETWTTPSRTFSPGRSIGAIYPILNIYSSISSRPEEDHVEISTKLHVVYPAFDLYAPVYPHFDLYNSSLRPMEDRQSSLSNQLTAIYPGFHTCGIPYTHSSYLATEPALYPHFELYPSTPVDAGVSIPDKTPRVEDRICLEDKHGPVPSRTRVAAGSEPTSVHRRLRSGTVNGSVPTLGTVEPPTPPATSAGHHMSTSPVLVVPTDADRCLLRRSSGLPSDPVVTRRSSSGPPMLPIVSTRALLGGPVDVTQSHVHPSLPLPNEQSKPKRDNALRRPSSMALPSMPVNDDRPGIDRSQSLSSRPHVPRKRDSLVLQRAKAFDTSSGTRERRESHRLSMHTLVQFPVPPLPKIPSISAASSVDQPLA